MTASILDAHLPRWHFRERHRRLVATTPQRALALAGELRNSDLPLTAALMALRSLPAGLRRRRRAAGTGPPIVDGFVARGFVLLGRDDTELVLGAVGKFWRARPVIERLTDAEEFDRFDRRGFAKAAVNFRAEAVDGGSMLTTETRVLAIGGRARLAFLPYWVLVRLGGELIRREMLAAVARRAAAP